MSLHQGVPTSCTRKQLRGSGFGKLLCRGASPRQLYCGQSRRGAVARNSATKDAPAAADDPVRLLPRPRLPESATSPALTGANNNPASNTALCQQCGQSEHVAVKPLPDSTLRSCNDGAHESGVFFPLPGHAPTDKVRHCVEPPATAAARLAAPNDTPQHDPTLLPSAHMPPHFSQAPAAAAAAPPAGQDDQAAPAQPPATHAPDPAASSSGDAPGPNAQPEVLLPTPSSQPAVLSHNLYEDGDKGHPQQHQGPQHQQQAAQPSSAAPRSPLVAAAQVALQAHLREQRMRRQQTAQRHYYHYTASAAPLEAGGQAVHSERAPHPSDGSSEAGSYVQLRLPFPQAAPGPPAGPIPPQVLPPGAAAAGVPTRQQVSGIRGSVGAKAGVSAHGRAEDDLLWGTAPRLSDGDGLDLELEASRSGGASRHNGSSSAASPSFLRLAEMRAANAEAAQGIPITTSPSEHAGTHVAPRAPTAMHTLASARLRPSTADVLQLPTPPSQQHLRRAASHLLPPSSARLRLPDPPATIKPLTHAAYATSPYVVAHPRGATEWPAQASGSVLDASASESTNSRGGVAGAWRKGRRLLQRLSWVMGWKRHGQQPPPPSDGAAGALEYWTRTAAGFDPRQRYDSDEQAKAVARAIINTYLNTPPVGSAMPAGQSRQGSGRGAGSRQGVWPQVQQEGGVVGNSEGSSSSIHSVEQAYAALAAMAAAAGEQERLAAELAAWLPDHPVSHVAVQGEVLRLQRDLLRAQVSLWRPVELLNGRMALLGLATGLYRELTSPDHPTLLAQALHQPLAMPATFLLIVLLTAVHQQLKPRMRTRGLLMSSTAHLWLGRLAMVGFVWAVVAEVQDPGHRALVVQLQEWGVGQLVLQGPVQDAVKAQGGRRLWDLLKERVWMAWF